MPRDYAAEKEACVQTADEFIEEFRPAEQFIAAVRAKLTAMKGERYTHVVFDLHPNIMLAEYKATCIDAQFARIQEYLKTHRPQATPKPPPFVEPTDLKGHLKAHPPCLENIKTYNDCIAKFCSVPEHSCPETVWPFEHFIWEEL